MIGEERRLGNRFHAVACPQAVGLEYRQGTWPMASCAIYLLLLCACAVDAAKVPDRSGGGGRGGGRGKSLDASAFARKRLPGVDGLTAA